MKGYIKIEAATYEGKEGLSVKTDLRDVSYMDRIACVNSLCHALHITPTELKLMAGLISSGSMEEMTDTKVLEDEEEPKAKCNCEACSCDGGKQHKKPNVHIIGGDAEDMLELLKDLLS